MMGADVAVVLVVFAIISLLFGYTLNLRQIGILIFVIVLQETLFVVMGIYTILWRYAEVLDYFRLGCICLFSGVVFFICDVFVAEPRYGGVACIFFMLLNANAIIFLRVLYRYLQYKVRKGNITKCENQPAVAKRLLIIGAGTASIHVFRETRTSQTGYIPVCFVDDDPNKINRRVNEVPIEGPSDRIPQLCKKYRVDVILFAIPSCGEERRKEILSICSTTGCEVKTLPFIHEIVFHSGAGLFEQARKVKIEDLLGRATVVFDDQSVQAYIQGKSLFDYRRRGIDWI
ncbi:MAG: nucleoside-diphosphate sugar epimerase/dehydratase [Clostridia bacterium]